MGESITKGLNITSSSQAIPADMGPGGSKLKKKRFIKSENKSKQIYSDICNSDFTLF